jgi:hypothetical protein
METTTYKFRDLTDNQFKALKEDAKRDELSPFAKFSLDTHSYRFSTSKGRQLDKWEVWEMGYRDAEKLLKGEYPIEVKYIGKTKV